MAERPVRAGDVCPACGRGFLVVRRGGGRGPFLGCSTLLILAAIVAGRILVEALGR
jgi:hypothetical protein